MKSKIDTLISQYQKKISVIDNITDDLFRNLSIAKKEYKLEKSSILKSQISNMENTRDILLSQDSCYEDFIKELEELKTLK